MKIESSNVSMVSAHEYSMHTSVTTSVTAGIQGRNDNSSGLFKDFFNSPMKTQQVFSERGNGNKIMSIKLLLLRRILDAISGRLSVPKENGELEELSNDAFLDLRNESDSLSVSSGAVWERTISTTSFFEEKEAVSFSSVGYANTADGRTISFGVELSLSRSFTAEYTQFDTAQYMITDPLVIDVGNMGTSVTDTKFFFDLDCDGEEESISFAGEGNGFLALDLNGDGIINDGSELFGTKSGNGFADLAKYDHDGNGWIDENDDIFDRLRVWTKDENGKDKLIDLKSADVGAIYLGSAPTRFALNNEYNQTNAFIRATGIFLKESGGTGTISQLDFTS